jgi:hypothetical protein
VLWWQEAYRNGTFEVIINQTRRRLVPVVPFLVTDGMEAWNLAMVKGWKAKRPCWICLIERGKMCDPKCNGRHRSADKVYSLMDKAQKDVRAARSQGPNKRQRTALEQRTPAEEKRDAAEMLKAQSVGYEVEVRIGLNLKFNVAVGPRELASRSTRVSSSAQTPLLLCVPSGLRVYTVWAPWGALR